MNFRVHRLEEVPSTNTYLRRLAAEKDAVPDGWLVVARRQTAGRGRMGRKWVAPEGAVLCFSFFVRAEVPPETAPSAGMAAALAVDDFLREEGLPSRPKWPNDVLVGGRKICGILCERAGNGLVIGIGLNVNLTPEQAAEIDRPATSILIETGRRLPLEEALDRLLPFLSRRIDAWREGGFAAIREEWTKRAGPPGRMVEVRINDHVERGVLAGFGSHGELLLKTNGEVRTVWSGEIPLSPEPVPEAES